MNEKLKPTCCTNCAAEQHLQQSCSPTGEESKGRDVALQPGSLSRAGFARDGVGASPARSAEMVLLLPGTKLVVRYADRIDNSVFVSLEHLGNTVPTKTRIRARLERLARSESAERTSEAAESCRGDFQSP